MKTIATTLGLFLLAATSVFSFPLSDLIGRWSYQNRATQGGGDVLRTQGYINVVYSYGKYIFQETNTDGEPVARYILFRDGRFTLTQGPVVSATGRWRKNSETVRVSGNITTPLGTDRFTCTFTMPSTNQLVIVQRVPEFETVSKWKARRE